MYYNRFLGRIVLDLVDYFLISAIVSIHCTEYLKRYSSEKQKMERLRQDLINKSMLMKSSSPRITPSLAKRVQKIYNFALTLRGGDDKLVKNTIEKLLYKNTEHIKTFVIYLVVIFQKRGENKKIINFLLSVAYLYLRIILIIWRINVSSCVDPVTGQLMVITMFFGGTTGFIISWIGVGATIVANLLGVVFIGRSFAQQLSQNIVYTKEYIKFKNNVVNSIEDEEVQSTIVPVAELIEDNKQKLKTLNWEQNPALKEAAERLGIFEEKPNFGPIKSTDNSLYKRYLEKKLGKAVKKVVDIGVDSDIIDVDFVDQDLSIDIPPIRIKD